MLDFGLASLGIGVVVGMVFPPLAVGLGIPAALAFRPTFVIICLAAGLGVGGVSWLVARLIIGRRISVFAARTAWVADIVARATYSGDWSGCAPESCELRVDSQDEFGDLARSFNDLLGALMGLHSVQDRVSSLSKGVLERSGLQSLANWGLEQTRASVGAVAGALLVTQSGALKTVASYGLANPEALAENRLLVTSLESAEPVLVHLPQGINVDRIVATSTAVEALVLPLRANSVPIGLLLLTLDQPATAGQLSLLALQAAPLGLAVQNAAGREALESLAAHDSLTGLCNRRFADAQLHDEFARAVRGQVPLGLLMLDLDHFKAVNDTYGHLAGDKVLRAIAGAAASVLRTGDSIARFGGEEFLILLPGADMDNARDVAERIRVVVSGLQLRAPEPLPTVTVSIGVTSWPETDAQSGADLVRMADEALFAAKQTGRNRVVVARPSASAEPALDGRARSTPHPSTDAPVPEPIFEA